MVLNNLTRVAILGMACTTPVFCESADNETTLEEIRGAIRSRIEAWYQDQGFDLCRGFGSGQIYDLEDVEIRLKGQTASVQYTFVEFQSCEEGAAYQKSRQVETWTRNAQGWHIVETPLRNLSEPAALIAAAQADRRDGLASPPPIPDAAPDERAIRQEEKRNEEVIRHAFASLNGGNLNAYLEYWGEDAKNFNVAMGRNGIRRGAEDILATFPDWHMEIAELIARGDSVVVRFTVSGTHRGVAKLPMNGGMLVGVEPTGKHFSVEHIHWLKLRDGRIVDHTATRNDIGMMRQLGLLPPRGLPK
jgi:predicted ester cyclase